MVIRFFKWLGISFLGIILFIILAITSFYSWEYITGGEFIEYLQKHQETVALDSAFSFHQIDNDIAKNDLILVGEVHGFKVPTVFDVNFFKHLNTKHNVQHYLAELDWVQAQHMNRYLKTGREVYLKKALQKWVVAQGRNNEDYLNKYRNLRNYYTLSDENNFEFIGIDKVQDVDLTLEYLQGLMTDSILKAPKIEGIESALTTIDNYLQTKDSISPSIVLDLKFIRQNLEYEQNKINREKCLFMNFESVHESLELKGKKLYGFFGLYHVFQYGINGQQPFAAQVRASNLGYERNMLSINFLMNDSYMVMPSKQLPKFMRTGKTYSKLPISSDNLLFMYIYGIKDFNRTTPEFHKSLIKLNAENSPYGESNRMRTTIKLLPVVPAMEMDEPDKPYVQYTVFVRNSDWAAPVDL